MAHSVAEFRAYLGTRSAGYTDSQVRKALEVAEFRRYLGDKAAGYSDEQMHKTLDLASSQQRGGDDRLLDVPDVPQPDDFGCGACVSKSVGMYYHVGPESLHEWYEALGTNVHTSTRPPDIVSYFRQLGCQVEAREHLTVGDLRDYWRLGWPVICCIQEYGIPSKQASFDYGHWVVCIGAALGQIFVSDPSIDNVLSGEDADQAKGRMMIDEKTWIRNWHDKDVNGNQYIRYGIAVGPPIGGNCLSRILKSHGNGKDHLDRLGGALPVIDPENLRKVDFVTYPKRIRQGSNCSSCQFNRQTNGRHECTFVDESEGIDMRGQLVNERNCCGKWNAAGTLRAWEQSGTVTKGWTNEESAKHPHRPKGPHGGQFAPKGEGGSPAADGQTKPYPPPDQARHPSLPVAPWAKSPAGDAATRNEAELKRPTPADYAKATPATSPSSWADHSPIHKSLEQKRRMLTTDLSSGVNRAFKLRLADGTQGVFKPASGESTKSIPSIPPQTGYRREVATSRVADILGLSDLVPTTTFRTESSDGIGSMQHFVAGAKNATEVKREQRHDGPEDARRAAVLDYLLCQIDRHQNNWMLKGEKLALIDNGRAFPTHYERREFELSAMFHMDFLRNAVVNDLDVPDLGGWRGKWEQIEKELIDCGIEDSAVQLAKDRYDHLMGRNSRKFADLPGFLEGYNLRRLFSEFGKRPAELESR